MQLLPPVPRRSITGACLGQSTCVSNVVNGRECRYRSVIDGSERHYDESDVVEEHDEASCIFNGSLFLTAMVAGPMSRSSSYVTSVGDRFR
jgi:hypothetical protein